MKIPQVLLSIVIAGGAFAIVQAGPRSPGQAARTTTNKTQSPEYERLMARKNAEVAPIESLAYREFESGDYRRALHHFQAADQVWSSVGMNPETDCIIECMYRLKRYKEIIAKINLTGGHKRYRSPAVGICYAELGRYKEAEKDFSVQNCRSLIHPELKKMIRAPKDLESLKTALHLQRGIDFYFNGNSKSAIEEFRTVLSRDPSQLVAAELGYRSALSQKNQAIAAYFAPFASKIPGRRGDSARSFIAHKTQSFAGGAL